MREELCGERGLGAETVGRSVVRGKQGEWMDQLVHWPVWGPGEREALFFFHFP